MSFALDFESLVDLRISGETQVAKNWKALVDKQTILLVFSNEGMILIMTMNIQFPPIPYVLHQWVGKPQALCFEWSYPPKKNIKKQSPNGPKYGNISDETLAWMKPYDL